MSAYCYIRNFFAAMEAKEFKEFGKEMIDYVANYLENIRDR